ncbi:MAG TPA: hypothetical protein VHW60_14765 [Caulobacteraceae bacterium]|jgi:hypothetical protein|nr:hypothetical protein [Caulobacteraceae bacterium]
MRLALAAALALFALPAAAQPGPAPDGGNPPPTSAHAPATPAMMAARHAAHEACAADMTRLCPDAATAGSHPMQCLRQHMSDISAPCAQALQAMRAARRAGQTQG